MVNSYDGIYQAERGKTTAGRAGRRMRADPSPLTMVPRPREDGEQGEQGEQEVMAPMQRRDAIVGGQDTKGLSLVLPCTEDPELFFAESPQDVEQAKAMCRGCPARLACLAGALERREPWGVWGGELLMSGAIVPRKRPRGRPRKDVVTIGANA
jgi:WhiB family redox-sensing transcriptional regulator